MKVLIDCIYTTFPSRCASAYKMKSVVEHLLLTWENMYIRWLLPDWVTDEDKEWLPNDDRIDYITIPMFKDRHKEYNYPRAEWIDTFTFRGEYYDTDIVLTNRTALVPLIKLNLFRPGHNSRDWSKKIVIFEDMPVMSFKGSIGLPHKDTQDIATLAGYIAADATALCAYWEKAKAIEIAKKYYNPSIIKKLAISIHESTPVIIESVKLKTKSFVFNKERPFVIGFAGRMVKGHNFKTIFKVMENHWILRDRENRKIECVVCTASRSSGLVDNIPKMVDIKHLSREDFWDEMKNRVHVGIFLSPEEDYSLSLIEPLTIGTPYAVYKCTWSLASLGKEYPFYCSNESEAYGIIKAFYDNYPKMYSIYVKWAKDYFEPLLLSRNEVSHFSVVDSVIEEYYREFDLKQSKTKTSVIGKILLDNDINGMIDIKEILQRLEKAGEIKHLGSKMNKVFQERISVSFSTNFNDFRLELLEKGYVDDSVRPGVLRKFED